MRTPRSRRARNVTRDSALVRRRGWRAPSETSAIRARGACDATTGPGTRSIRTVRALNGSPSCVREMLLPRGRSRSHWPRGSPTRASRFSVSPATGSTRAATRASPRSPTGRASRVTSPASRRSHAVTRDSTSIPRTGEPTSSSITGRTSRSISRNREDGKGHPTDV